MRSEVWLEQRVCESKWQETKLEGCLVPDQDRPGGGAEGSTRPKAQCWCHWW